MIAVQSMLAVLRFVLEVILVAIYGSFGFRLGQGLATGLDWILGIGLPASLVVVWGRFVAPRASHRLSDPPLLVLELALFFVGMAMLVLRTQAAWGLALLVAFVLDRVLLDRLGKPAWAEPR